MEITSQKITGTLNELSVFIDEQDYELESDVFYRLYTQEYINSWMDFVSMFGTYSVNAEVFFPEDGRPIVRNIEVLDNEGNLIVVQTTNGNLSEEDLDDYEYFCKAHPLPAEELSIRDNYWLTIKHRTVKDEDLRIGGVYFACGRLESGDNASYADPRNYFPVVYLGGDSMFGSYYARINGKFNAVEACDVRNVFTPEVFVELFVSIPGYLITQAEDAVVAGTKTLMDKLRNYGIKNLQ